MSSTTTRADMLKCLALIGLFIAGSLVAVLLALTAVVAVLKLSFDSGYLCHNFLCETRFYPGWVNVVLAVLFGVLTCALAAGLVAALFTFLAVLLVRPLVALAAAGLLLVFALKLVGAIANPPAFPGVSDTSGWILSAVFIVLGVAGVFVEADQWLSGGGWEKLTSSGNHSNSLGMDRLYPNRLPPRIKFRGEGFVVFDRD